MLRSYSTQCRATYYVLYVYCTSKNDVIVCVEEYCVYVTVYRLYGTYCTVVFSSSVRCESRTVDSAVFLGMLQHTTEYIQSRD